ncbi:mercuric transporter MerT family protein [Methylosinus sp. Ce-a6]|uniref:mercuric transporter MerT family protein n=1 Tax=Methylosinus sp. Ce-a6 TaxID=2172005 RepID=UPI00135828C2|nr:mercuric transporter MerT family protein [Methylosinus sp. Ce-a6]
MPINENLSPSAYCRSEPVGKAAPAEASSSAQRLLAAGGLLGALAASSCCVLPLALFSFGVGGAWIGQLTRLAPYQPYFVAFTAACLALGLWSAWRSRRDACGTGAACATVPTNRLVVIGFVLSAALVAVALAADLVIPLLFE